MKAIVEQGQKQADPKANAKQAPLILPVKVISAQKQASQKQASQMLADLKVNAKLALLILLVMVISAQKQASQKVIAKLILLVKVIAGGPVLALKPENVCLMI